MNKKLRFLAAFPLVAVFLSACTTLSPPAPNALVNDDYSLVKEYMRKYIVKEMKKAQLVGMSVALIDSDQIVWSEGFGYADKEAKSPATDKTRYRAGSVSKLFTAISVMQQAEKGQLDIDKPLGDYIPEFNINSRFGSIDQITLRNTLSHHSGLPDSYVDGMWSKEPESFRNVATYLNDYYTAFPPNTVFSYSNSGYSLAGHAVENTSGQPFSEYQTEHILNPLGMKESNFEMDVRDVLVSNSYWRGKKVEELSLRDLPAGGLVTNVKDLSQLVIEMHAAQTGESTILMPSTLQQMMKAQQYDSAFELTRYNGIGFMHHPNLLSGQFNAIGHGGQTMAHSALLISIPELQLGAVLLANSPSLSGQLNDIMSELLKVSIPVKTRKPLDLSAPSTNIALPGTETGFEGRYASPMGMAKITGGPTSYKVLAVNQKFSLKPNAAEEYKAKFKLFGFIPVAPEELARVTFHAREVNGSKMIIANDRSEQIVLATELTEQPVNDAWHKRIGSYTLSNPIDTDIDMFNPKGIVLGYEEGLYYVDIESPAGKTRMGLKVINDSQIISQGWGRGMGETMFARPDGSLVTSGLILIKNPD